MKKDEMEILDYFVAIELCMTNIGSCLENISNLLKELKKKVGN